MKAKSILLFILTLFLCSNVFAAEALVVQSKEYSSYANAAATKLEAAGFTVTEATSFPSDLSFYDAIWDFRINSAFSTDEQEQLEEFLQDGKKAYIIGENSGFTTRNDSIVSLIATLGGGTITVGSATNSTQNIDAPFNTEASSITYLAAGGFDGKGTGAYITDTGEESGYPSSALLFDKGTLENAPKGILIAVLDINFITATSNGNEELCAALIDFALTGQITYEGNGNTTGTVPVDNSTYSKGDTITVLGNTGELGKTGYTFSGWNTTADGSGDTYLAGNTFTCEGEDLTLYAQWQKKADFPWPIFTPAILKK